MITLDLPSLNFQSNPLETDAVSASAMETQEPAMLDVMIAYEDASAGHRAIRAVRNLAREISPPIALHPSLWRFDLLEDPLCGGEADADADRASLFVVATTTLSKVPADIDHWVNACMARKQGAATAIIALFGPLDAWTITIQDKDGVRTASQILR